LDVGPSALVSVLRLQFRIAPITGFLMARSSRSSGGSSSSSDSHSLDQPKSKKTHKGKQRKKKDKKQKRDTNDKKKHRKEKKALKERRRRQKEQEEQASFEQSMAYAKEVAAANMGLRAAADEEREARRQKKASKAAARAAETPSITSDASRAAVVASAKIPLQRGACAVVVDANDFDPTKKPDADYSRPDPLAVANSGLDVQRAISMMDRSHYTTEQLKMHDARNARLGT
ncbi:unnamed protein product, partial [Prorocentrum cordatum]